MLWLLVRVDRFLSFFIRPYHADIVTAISEIAKGEILNRHIYNTAMNSIEKDRKPDLQPWGPVNASDIAHRGWMRRFVFRSGKYGSKTHCIR